ncbi:unnamed protein product [Lathyrus sativus]|nr:unnamed protein product [Lathyrus sativus]
MSLNCLTCGHILKRDNSDRENNFLEIEKSYTKKTRLYVDRSWSGNIAPPQSKGGGGGVVVDNTKPEFRRANSAGNVGPRLLRSSGMRRDWRLEELIGQQENGVRCNG